MRKTSTDKNRDMQPRQKKKKKKHEKAMTDLMTCLKE